MTTAKQWKQLIEEYLVIARGFELTPISEKVIRESMVNDLARYVDEMMTYPIDKYWLEIPPGVTNATVENPVIYHYHRYINQGGRIIPMAMYDHSPISDEPMISVDLYYPIRQDGVKFYIPKPIEPSHIRIGEWHVDVKSDGFDGDWDFRAGPTRAIDDEERYINRYYYTEHIGELLLCGLNYFRSLPNGHKVLEQLVERIDKSPVPLLNAYDSFEGCICGYSQGIKPTNVGDGYLLSFVADADVFEKDDTIALALIVTNTGVVPTLSIVNNVNQVMVNMYNYNSAAPKTVYCGATGQPLGYIDSIRESNRPSFVAAANVIFHSFMPEVFEEAKVENHLDIYIELINGSYYLTNSMIGLNLKKYLEHFNEPN